MRSKALTRYLILVAGHGCLDLSVELGEMPEPGSLALIQDYRLTVGGPGAAAAVTLAHLGYPTQYTGVVGTFRSPAIGNIFRDLLRDEGVDVRRVRRYPSADPSFTIIPNITGTERRFFHRIGANSRLSSRHISIPPKPDGPAGFYLGGMGILPELHGGDAARVLKNAKEKGYITAFDTADPGAGEAGGSAFKMIEPALSWTDVVFLSLSETARFFKDEKPEAMAARVLTYGPSVVVIKMGDKGMYVFYEKAHKLHKRRVPAFKVKAKGTTGCGDASSAATFAKIVPLLARRTPDSKAAERFDQICAAVRFGAAVGAIVAEKGMGVHGVPSEDDVNTFMGERTPRKRTPK